MAELFVLRMPPAANSQGDSSKVAGFTPLIASEMQSRSSCALTCEDGIATARSKGTSAHEDTSR